VVVIFAVDGAFVSGFVTTAADKRSPFDSLAMFRFKTAANAITFMTGFAFDITDEQFAAGIGLLTIKTVDTEVIGIIETAAIPEFFRDGGRIFAKEFCDFSKRFTVI
jgi:hypothetical protein